MSQTSVIIVNWNTRDLLLACLAAVATHAPGVPVYVVDNASTDGSVEAVKALYPGVLLTVNAENVGFARANNQVLRAIATPYAWLLNSDTEIRAGALQALEAVLDRQPHTAVVGSALFNADGSLQPCSFDFPGPLATSAEWWLLPRPLARARDRLFRLGPRRVEGPTGWVLGASLLVRRAAVAEVGLLDEGFFMYGEELDWCRRFQTAGWQVRLALGSEVVHHGGASTKQVAERMLIELFRTRTRYIQRHHPRAWRPFVTLMALGARWNGLYVRLRPQAGLNARLVGALAHVIAHPESPPPPWV